MQIAADQFMAMADRRAIVTAYDLDRASTINSIVAEAAVESDIQLSPTAVANVIEGWKVRR